MTDKSLQTLVRQLRTDWLENYVQTFEAGRVQKHPHARFVTAKGECCVVAAMAAARSGDAFVGSEHWMLLLGTELEELSRRFEARRLTSQDVYEEALLALAERRPERSVDEGSGTVRRDAVIVGQAVLPGAALANAPRPEAFALSV